MHSISDQLNQVRRAAWTGIIGATTLAALKIVAGFVGHSYALLADGVEACGDAVSGIIVLLGLKVAEQPPDAEHPYGHSRAEDIAGNTISTMMLVSGFILLWTNVQGLYVDLTTGAEHQMPHAWTLWLILSSLLIKICLFIYKRQVDRVSAPFRCARIRGTTSTIPFRRWSCLAAFNFGAQRFRLGRPSRRDRGFAADHLHGQHGLAQRPVRRCWINKHRLKS